MSNKANRKIKQSIDVLSSSEEHDEQDDQEEEYEVEKILDSRINPKTKAREYLVKWENYSEKQATWEPLDNLSNVMDIVQKYEKQLKGKSGKKSDVDDSEQQGKDTKTTLKKQEESKKVVEKKTEQQDGKRRSMGQKKKDDGEEKDQDNREDYLDKEDESRGSKKRSIQKEYKIVVEEDEEDEEEQELVFVEIIDKRVTPQGTVEYLIHFQDVENQWVEESQLGSVSEEIKAFDSKREAEVAAAAAQKKQAESDAQEQKLKKAPSRLTAKRTMPFEKPQTKQLVVVEATTPVPAAQAQPAVAEQQQSVSNKIASKKSVLTATEKLQPLAKHTEKTELGDFKTDNVDHVELQGEFTDVLSSRFEVFWKTRNDGVTPAQSFFSSSYLKRYEPTVLIDYLISLNNTSIAKGSRVL